MLLVVGGGYGVGGWVAEGNRCDNTTEETSFYNGELLVWLVHEVVVAGGGVPAHETLTFGIESPRTQID